MLRYIYTVLLVSVCFQARALAEVTCKIDNACRCTLDDGTKRFFDLNAISSSNEPYFKVGSAGDVYYYDPCVPFTIPDSVDGCKDVAGCYNEQGSDSTSYTAIALHNRVVFDYNEYGENLILHYDNGKSGSDVVTLSVILNCYQDIEDVMEVVLSTPTAFQFLIESPSVCLQNSAGKGLSAGSLLCIILSLLVAHQI